MKKTSPLICTCKCSLCSIGQHCWNSKNCSLISSERWSIVGPVLLMACKHVRDNLREESPEVWEHEIAHLDTAIKRAEEVGCD